jgi:hypothetical protein
MIYGRRRLLGTLTATWNTCSKRTVMERQLAGMTRAAVPSGTVSARILR